MYMNFHGIVLGLATQCTAMVRANCQKVQLTRNFEGVNFKDSGINNLVRPRILAALTRECMTVYSHHGKWVIPPHVMHWRMPFLYGCLEDTWTSQSSDRLSTTVMVLYAITLLIHEGVLTSTRFGGKAPEFSAPSPPFEEIIQVNGKLKQNEANKEKDDIGPYPIQDRAKGAQFYSMNPQFHTPLELEGKQLCATPPTLLPATFIAILLTYKSLFPFHYFSPKNPTKYHGWNGR